MNCELCGKERKLIKHHLRYSPELTIFLCFPCHLMLHVFNKLDDAQKQKFLEWVNEYGKFWEPGNLLYRSTESYKVASKNRARKHELKPEAREKKKKYFKDHRDERCNYLRGWRATEHGKELKKNNDFNWNNSEKGKKYKHDWYERKRLNNNP